MKQHFMPIISNQQVSSRYWHMVVDSSRLTSPIEPGQFFHIRCSQGSFPFLRRPFSIYRINESTIEFLYLVKGEGTQEMTHLQAGEMLDVVGPLGVGFSLDKSADTILLVARGVGIATLAALAQEAVEKNVKCAAILSARSKDDLLAADLLQGFGAEVYKVTEEDGTSDVANVEEIIRGILKRNKIDGIYTCGSRRLSRLSQNIANEYHIPGEIALEEHMGCAMGACFACVCDVKEDTGVKSVRVCLEGPVFSLEKVVLG
ncbi:dihydroorotate dehydrogenase electron transfer subunit [Bacillus piscicola]|uniref:dihydroorotate dehydrogenase electron transfer subunit n=1 Tax=Bacillus piscicola TaxID=1632684 RepID=UPI001F08BC0A|nr:dihydroorotate dehydrogenase electron transfer subunit [Bacillus piscicola]